MLARPPKPAEHPPAHWVAALGACAVLGFFTFVREARVPLLSLVDLGFHELGHLVMYVFPINQVLTAAMGSIMQVAVPIGLAVYFGWRRRDRLAMAVCLAWAATNFRDASVYIADAPYEQLELIGGEHDWAYVLGPEAFDRLDQAASIARTVHATGVVMFIVACAIAAFGLWDALSASRRAARRVEATVPTPDDRFPSR
jgi:hypothetical protein